ncbi:DNA repair and recombination protein RadB [Candidatus Woesearchaeota archaeon]|nr:DNA repair and recombination protein RadB [Candidatus Woesearchaeota archaeon]
MEENNKVSSGINFLDNLLGGGYDRDIVTTVYGSSGAGKTNLCLLAMVRMAGTGKKVIFIDTEGGIAVERVKQITKHYQDVLKRVIFFQPVNFKEQKETFESLKKLIDEKIGLIVVDSIAMLYRLELGKKEDVYEVNSALAKQIACLTEITRRWKIPVLITNQVYANFENKNQVKMVGGDLLKYGSKCLIELVNFNNSRGLVLRKHRSLPEGLECKFKITEKGMEQVE